MYVIIVNKVNEEDKSIKKIIKIMKQTKSQEKSELHITSIGNDDYKRCPECGQNKIPFKMGVCMCGYQVGKIQYIKNTKLFAKNYYPHQEQFDIALEEIFVGIPEWEN